MAVAAFAGVKLYGQTTTVATETPLAGLTLSFDKYCETVLDNMAKQESVAAAQDAEETTVQQTTVTAKSSPKTQEKEEPKIKLNLVYDRLGVVHVKGYLNVRKKPSENSKVVGKMTNNAGCNIYTIKKGWAKIVSGGVRGWVKAKYLIKDAEAEKKAQQVATLRATVNTETLNVRSLPTTEASVYDQISVDEDYTVEKQNLTADWVKQYVSKHCKKKQLKGIDMDSMYDNVENWVLLSIDNEKAFVSKDFIKLTYSLNRAVSIKEEKQSSSGSGSSGSGHSSLASSIVNYAMKFLGNRYVYGGTSLTNGTDCSGFTMRIYQHFGYSIPRTSGSQAAATRSVSSGNERVGDLFFYGSGSVSHVALYIGNGQIIHASNARDGIKISSAYYRKPLKIGRVL